MRLNDEPFKKQSARTANGSSGFDRILGLEVRIDLIDLTAFSVSDFITEVAVLAPDTAFGMQPNLGSGGLLFLEGFSHVDFEAKGLLLT